MKRKFWIILIALFCVIFSLTACNKDNKDDTDTDIAPSFKIASSRTIYHPGDEPIMLSVDGALPPEYNELNVSYIIDYIDEGLDYLILDSGAIQFNGIGMATIKGQVGDLCSINSITIYSVPLDTEISERIGSVFLEPIYLGRRADIGIPPSIAHLYRVDNADGFLKINNNGELEFIGLYATKARAKISLGNSTLYEGMYSMESDLSKRMLNYLANNNIILDTYTDVSNTMLGNLVSLEITYTNVGKIEEYSFLKYCKALKNLDLSGSPLFDLSFLSGLSSIESIIIDNCYKIENKDEGLTLYNTLASLSSLSQLSISGAFSCFNRSSYDMLVSLVKRGRLNLRVLEDTVVNAQNIIPFSETVFFTMEEYLKHIEANGSITPNKDFNHAILCLTSDMTTTATNNYIEINATPISILELYGDERDFGTYIVSDNDLTLNLYDYRIKVTNIYGGSPVMIKEGTLNLNANRGTCSLTAGNGIIYDWWGDYIDAGSGISAKGCTVNLLSSINASLYITGGNGDEGFDGKSDGSNPDDRTSRKHGSPGGYGGSGIFAEYVHLLGGKITIYGGNGGKGGDGADGSDINIFSGGYNAGHGNMGGTGGNALLCKEYTTIDEHLVKLIGGTGGSGGKGGKGYLAGSDGDDYTQTFNGLPFKKYNY